jgi:hypothetical protein
MFDSDLPFPQAISAFADCSKAAAANFPRGRHDTRLPCHEFAGMHLDNRAKMKGKIMCTRWHTRGDCFADCKNKASHVACSEIPSDAKQGHLRWMQKCRRE